MRFSRVLITGGAGFIGSHLVAALQDHAEEIRVLDNLRSGKRANLAGLRHTFLEGSVTDRPMLEEAVAGVEVVFHLAAMVSVPESIEHPEECLEVNTLGTVRLLDAASRAGVKKVCLSSTAAIYGNDPEVPKREDMTPRPLSPYALTKLDAEMFCDFYTRMHGLPTVCLRYFNVFGPRQDPASAYAAAVPIFVQRALRQQPLLIHGDGAQTRDFIYVGDVAAANLHLASHTEATGVFNVARGGRMSILDLAQAIQRETGSSSEIHFGPERPGDIKHSQADVSRLLDAGYSPGHTFEEGLRKTLDQTQADGAI